MHDYTLGGPVETGSYDGPLLAGKPLHSGGCNDGVYGCTKCNSRARSLSDEELKEIGFPTSIQCDWCHGTVSAQDISLYSAWDEPSVKSEVCSECRRRDRSNLQEEEEFDRKRDDSFDFADDRDVYTKISVARDCGCPCSWTVEGRPAHLCCCCAFEEEKRIIGCDPDGMTFCDICTARREAIERHTCKYSDPGYLHKPGCAHRGGGDAPDGDHNHFQD
jgi:hypothetical protein